MKVLITGPRQSYLDENLQLPWMHIEVDIEVLPNVGEVIVLNSGSTYYVKDRMWWIDAPENEAYWSRAKDYEVKGEYQTCHLLVEPDERPERYGYPAGLEEGRKRGGEEWFADLRELIDLAKSADVDGIKLVDTWLAMQETKLAERRAAESELAQTAARALAAIRKDKDHVPGDAPPAFHTGLLAHDGYAEHSHEVRPDHKGVARKEQR